jgi:hypothetical protein
MSAHCRNVKLNRCVWSGGRVAVRLARESIVRQALQPRSRSQQCASYCPTLPCREALTLQGLAARNIHRVLFAPAPGTCTRYDR